MSNSLTGAVGYDPRYQGQEVYDLEGEDDTYGSGIFDPEGRAGTSNPNMGVFASHNSLPGYIARDVPFTVQDDVTDITDNAAVVSVPGGGMFYVEKKGRLGGAAIMGPTWRPPQIEPAGYTRHDQVYAFMNRSGQHGHDLFPGAPVRTQPPLRRPARTSQRHAYRVPGVPAARVVAFNRVGHRVGKESIVRGTQLPIPIGPSYADPVAPAAPGMPMEPQVPFQQTVNVATQQIAIDGFGKMPRYSSLQHPGRRASLAPPHYSAGRRATPGGVFGQGLPDCPEGTVADIDTLECVPEERPGPTPAQLAIYGLLAGAGVGLVVGVMRMKK